MTLLYEDKNVLGSRYRGEFRWHSFVDTAAHGRAWHGSAIDDNLECPLRLSKCRKPPNRPRLHRPASTDKTLRIRSQLVSSFGGTVEAILRALTAVEHLLLPLARLTKRCRIAITRDDKSAAPIGRQNRSRLPSLFSG